MTVFGSAMPAEGGAAPNLSSAFVGPCNFTAVNSAHHWISQAPFLWCIDTKKGGSWRHE